MTTDICYMCLQKWTFLNFFFKATMRPVLCTKVHECSHVALNPVASLADQGNETENEDNFENNFESWFICTDWFEEQYSLYNSYSHLRPNKVGIDTD